MIDWNFTTFKDFAHLLFWGRLLWAFITTYRTAYQNDWGFSNVKKRDKYEITILVSPLVCLQLVMIDLLIGNKSYTFVLFIWITVCFLVVGNPLGDINQWSSTSSFFFYLPVLSRGAIAIRWAVRSDRATFGSERNDDLRLSLLQIYLLWSFFNRKVHSRQLLINRKVWSRNHMKQMIQVPLRHFNKDSTKNKMIAMINAVVTMKLLYLHVP